MLALGGALGSPQQAFDVLIETAIEELQKILLDSWAAALANYDEMKALGYANLADARATM